MNKKQVIRINENQIKQIVMESVKRILKEESTNWAKTKENPFVMEPNDDNEDMRQAASLIYQAQYEINSIMAKCQGNINQMVIKNVNDIVNNVRINIDRTIDIKKYQSTIGEAVRLFNYITEVLRQDTTPSGQEATPEYKQNYVMKLCGDILKISKNMNQISSQN